MRPHFSVWLTIAVDVHEPGRIRQQLRILGRRAFARLRVAPAIHTGRPVQLLEFRQRVEHHRLRFLAWLVHPHALREVSPRPLFLALGSIEQVAEALLDRPHLLRREISRRILHISHPGLVLLDYLVLFAHQLLEQCRIRGSIIWLEACRAARRGP
jgi:hypothetical protein